MRITSLIVFFILVFPCGGIAGKSSKFKVVAFYTAANDPAHISFVREANAWFSHMAEKYHFEYSATNDWNLVISGYLEKHDVVVFLDSRPEGEQQRTLFQEYMEKGGAWMGFHFAGFSLTSSAFPQNWNWYHELFLGSGEYKGNTWRPTPAVLRVENRKHPVTRHLPETFLSSPNEWYSWGNDLRLNPSIEVLLSVDSRSYPLGTGPKQHEIWHSGDYPVVWTNKYYNMLYINMGHNDMDYDKNPPEELSLTFVNRIQNKLILNGLFWLSGRAHKSVKKNCITAVEKNRYFYHRP